MTDLHTQLAAWLADGALGDPPREIAVHASVCEQCAASLGAFDALALIDVGAAGSPPPLGARSRLRVGTAWARVGTALTATVLAGLVVGFGIAQLVGSGEPASGQPGEPEGTELAGLFAPSNEAAQSDAAPGDATPGEAPTATALPTPLPGATPGPQAPPVPGATPRPSATAAPTPAPTSAPTATPAPTSGPTATPAPTPEPTPAPTPEPTPEPTPTPTPAPTPEPTLTPAPTSTPTPQLSECSNSIDDDNDGYVDLLDPRCTGPLDDSEGPPDP